MTQSMQVDVVVVGSGAAGLIAALTAATSGAEVVLLEGARFWGGTTAMSGAQLWIPNNHRMADLGASDSFEDAFAYCSAHTMARDPGLIEAFLHAAPEMARFVEQHSPLEFQACAVPDSFAEQPSGRVGRHLEPQPFALGDLGTADELFWPAPYPMVFTNEEVMNFDLIRGTDPTDLYQRRIRDREVCMGYALVAGLLAACQTAGVRLVRNCRVEHLSVDGRRVARGGGTELGRHSADCRPRRRGARQRGLRVGFQPRTAAAW
jgi:3-oxosteroid 1-dehydrogenase